MADRHIDEVDQICALVLNAARQARVDPEAALVKARKAAEAICRSCHRRVPELGDPKQRPLGQLLDGLLR